MTALLAGDSKSLPELALSTGTPRRRSSMPFTVPQIRFISLAEAAHDDKRILRIGTRPSEIVMEPDNGSILNIFTTRGRGHK